MGEECGISGVQGEDGGVVAGDVEVGGGMEKLKDDASDRIHPVVRTVLAEPP